MMVPWKQWTQLRRQGSVITVDCSRALEGNVSSLVTGQARQWLGTLLLKFQFCDVFQPVAHGARDTDYTSSSHGHTG
jgi:hypothetical protein